MNSMNIASASAQAVETLSAKSILPDRFETAASSLIKLIESYYDFLNKEDGPSSQIVGIMQNHDIEIASEKYLDKIEAMIAANVPEAKSIDRRRLFNIISKYYAERGSQDSIHSFFHIFYNEVVSIVYPKDFLFNTSDTQSLLSDRFKIRDSYKWQEFSYMVNNPTDSSIWKGEFLKFVHPAGLKFFVALTLEAFAKNEWHLDPFGYVYDPWTHGTEPDNYGEKTWSPEQYIFSNPDFDLPHTYTGEPFDWDQYFLDYPAFYRPDKWGIPYWDVNYFDANLVPGVSAPQVAATSTATFVSGGIDLDTSITIGDTVITFHMGYINWYPSTVYGISLEGTGGLGVTNVEAATLLYEIANGLQPSVPGVYWSNGSGGFSDVDVTMGTASNQVDVTATVPGPGGNSIELGGYGAYPPTWDSETLLGGDIYARPMFDPTDICTFWEFIKWGDLDDGQHTPLLQPSVEMVMVYILKTINNSATHYRTHINTIDNVSRNDLRAIFSFLTIKFISVARDVISSSFYEHYVLESKFFDQGSFGDGFLEYTIDTTFKPYRVAGNERFESWSIALSQDSFNQSNIETDVSSALDWEYNPNLGRLPDFQVPEDDPIGDPRTGVDGVALADAPALMPVPYLNALIYVQGDLEFIY